MLEYKIHGSKGGEEKAHTPVETPNNLLSVAYAKVLIAVAEGELAGRPTDQDIFLDGTPLANSDGSLNFGGVKWEWRSGTTDQEHIEGLPEVSTEYSVGVELKTTAPWTRLITKPLLSAARITFQWPALLKQAENGDTEGLVIDYAVDISSDGGPFVEYAQYQINGKTNTTYERTHRINLPKDKSSWTIRARRLTVESESSTVQDTMNVKSYAEVVDAKQRYPNTALLYVEFDSRLFGGGSIPKISVRTKGRIIQVPSNYDPENRTYTGIWAGDFKWAWTDNPAWVFYDIVTQNRFGLGHKVSADMVDKWALYEVAQYCDVLVDDGTNTNTKEPRHTCNIFVQEKATAWKLLRDIASIFNGMTYWNGNKFVAIADKEEDISNIPLFSRANVVAGKFNYQAADDKSIYTSALVSYDDPNNHFNTEVEAAFENSQIIRWGGDRQVELSAIGCTSRGEAQRKAKYTLITNMYNRTVSFQTGLQGLNDEILPGNLIHVLDPLIGGKPFTGRIISAVGRVITLDRPIEAVNGDILYMTRANGTSEGRTINNVHGNVVELNVDYTESFKPNTVWYLESSTLKSQLFRVTKISSPSESVYEIEGVEYNESKYGAVDNGARLEPRPISVVPAGIQAAPASVQILSHTYTEQTMAVAVMTVSWPQTQGATQYEAQWKVNDGDWVNLGVTGALEFNVKGIYTGQYLARVRAINALGIKSVWTTSTLTLLEGKVGTPPRVASLTTTPMLFGIRLDWQFPEGATDTLRTEFWHSETTNFVNGTKLGDFAYPQDYHEMHGLQAGKRFYFWCRLVDRSGNIGPWYPSDTEVGILGMSAINDNGQYNDYFAGLISETALDKELYAKIESIIDNTTKIDSVAEELEQLTDTVAVANDAIRQATSDIADLELQVQVNSHDINAELSNVKTNLNTAIVDLNKEIDVAVDEMTVSVDGKVKEVNTRIDGLNKELDDAVNSIENLDGRVEIVNDRVDQANQDLANAVDDLQVKIDAIQDALVYDPNKSYKSGETVRLGNNLYQAISDVPAGFSPPNTVYWQDIGVILEQANNLASRVDANTVAITNIDGKIESTSSNLEVLRAAYRDDDGEGDLNGALKLWDTEAKIAREQLTRASDDKALAQVTQLISARVDNNIAQISTLEKTVADTNKANAQRITSIGTEVGNANSQILLLQDSISEAGKATATSLESLTSKVDENTATIRTVSETVVTNNSATANRIDNLATSVEGNSSKITELSEVVSNLDGSTAIRIEALQAGFREYDGEGDLLGALKDFDTEAKIAQESLVRASNDQALAQRVSYVTARVGDSEGKISTLERVQATTNSVTAERLDRIDASVADNNGSISNMQVVIANDRQVTTEELSRLTSEVGDNKSEIINLTKTFTDANTATAENLENLGVTVSQNTASISSLSEVVANIDGSTAQRIDILQATYRDDTGEGSLQDALNGFDSSAKIATEQIVRASDDKSLAQSITVVSSKVDDNQAQIVQISKTVADANSASAELINRLTADVGNSNSQIVELSRVIADNTSASAEQISSLNSKVGDNTSAISDLSRTIVDSNSATAQTLQNIDVRFGTNEASISNLESVVSNLDGSTAVKLEALQASFRELDGEGDLNGALDGFYAQAKISQEQMVRASETKSLAQNTSVISSRLGDSESKLSTLELTVSEVNKATASQLTKLEASIGDNNSNISNLYQVVATTESSSAQRFEQLDSKFTGINGETNASISSLAKTVTDADSALAQRIESTDANVGGNSARIVVVETAQSNLEEAFASVSTAINSSSRSEADGEEGQLVDALNAYTADANFKEEVLTRASEDKAAAQRVSVLEATFTKGLSDANARIAQEELVRTTADSAIAQSVSTLDAKLSLENSNLAAIVSSERVARVTATDAIAQDLNLVRATTDNNTAQIRDEAQARTTADSAIAQSVTNLSATIVPSDTIDSRISSAVQVETQARVNANYATASQLTTVESKIIPEKDIDSKISSSVAIEAKARSDFDGKVQASWTVKMEANSNGQYVAAGIGLGIENTTTGLLQSQFLVRADRFAVVNGTSTTTAAPFVVQNGQVFISSAMIANGSIDNAQIGSQIYSTNYVAQQSGWLLNKNGAFEINSTVPGQGRIILDGSGLKVYDANNVLRVQVGNLN